MTLQNLLFDRVSVTSLLNSFLFIYCLFEIRNDLIYIENGGGGGGGAGGRTGGKLARAPARTRGTVVPTLDTILFISGFGKVDGARKVGKKKQKSLLKRGAAKTNYLQNSESAILLRGKRKCGIFRINEGKVY